MSRVHRFAVIVAVLVGTTLATVGTPGATAWAARPLAATASVTAGARTEARAAQVASDYTSIFAGQVPQLDGAGWAACPAPVTWSFDGRGLRPAVASTERALLAKAFATWSAASGLTFQYSGDVPVTYRTSDYTAVPADGVSRSHHLYIGFLADAESDLITRTNPGFGGPAPVAPGRPTIDGGYAFFSTDYLTARGTSKARATNLMLHEIGHALGLGHAARSANVMYSVVAAKTHLGAGDVRGVRSFTKPCAA